MSDDRYDDRNDALDVNQEESKSHDYRELEDGEEQRKELRSRKQDEVSKDSSQSDDRDKDYEDVCFICRRPESKAGKMFHLPNNICVCDDCMHKTMDTVSQFDYQGMLNTPNMTDLNNGKGFPSISFVNLADLQGDGGIPNKQKPKKKKKSGEIGRAHV